MNASTRRAPPPRRQPGRPALRDKSMSVAWLVPREVPHATGVRGVAATIMQLACRAGVYEVEALVHHVEGLRVVGQVVTAENAAVPGLQLALVDENGVVLDRTMTDPCGEFDLMGDEGGRCGLRVGPGSGAPCVLLWDGVMA